MQITYIQWLVPSLETCWALLLLFFFYLYKVVTTRGSPFGISRDIYRGGTPVRVDYIIGVVCWPCRFCWAWFPSSCSDIEWKMLLRKLETLAVCIWNFRIRCGGRLCSTAGRFLENRLHSVIRCPAVWIAFSGQLQIGEVVFSILYRYARNLPWFVRNCVRIKFGHRERDSL